jgi:lipopolysaccharide transport system ATP-binding protein
LEKINDVGSHGRTVLFVSHNMPAVTRLCNRTILLDEGGVVSDGPSHQVVAHYLRSGHGTSAIRTWTNLEKAPGDEIVRLIAVRVRTEDNELQEAVDIRKPVGIEMEYEVLRPDHILVPNYHFFNDEGVYAFIVADSDLDWRNRERPVGTFTSTAWIPGNFLAEGTMIVSVAITNSGTFEHPFLRTAKAVAFQVVDSIAGDQCAATSGAASLE